jgi:predicted amidohydrolase
MSAKTKVAVVQMTSGPDVEKNLRTAEAIVREAAADGARVIVLPECFAYLGPEKGKHPIAEPLPAGGPILARMSALAAATKAELVLGGFWERGSRDQFSRNACVHLDARGGVKSIYRKIHLFDVDLPDGTKLEESASVEPGTEIVATETAFGTLGLSVCYDVRFPELYRALVDRGAIAMAIPAAFTATTGKDHWHVLLRARAIESQSYVLAAAQTGHHFGERRSYGHALIADPWGVVLAEHGEGEGFASAFLDPSVVERVRKSLPSLRHRVLGR